MKKALVLAGGLPQIELIKELHNRGYYIILADFLENPIAQKYADKFYRESTLDIETIKKITIDEKIDILCTCCTDQALNTVSIIADELNLPSYINANIGQSVTNKQYMKNIFKKYNIPTANFQIINNPNQICKINFPAVVKPVDCNSSKGVVKVCSQDNLKLALKNAIDYSRTNTAIIEEFIDGYELSIDLIVTNSVAKIICYSFLDKIKSETQFVIFRSRYNPNLSKKILKDIDNIAQKIVKAFKLVNCPMLIQLILKDNNIYIVEFSTRTGGCSKYRIIELVSGINIIKYTADLFENKITNIAQSFNYTAKYIVDEFIYCKQGQFNKLEGFDELLTDNYLKDVFLLKNKNEKLNGINSSGDRIAAITYVANSYEDYVNKHNYVISKIKVLDVNNNDIMRHDLLPLIEL